LNLKYHTRASTIDEAKLIATFLEVKWSTLNKEDCEKILKDLIAKASMFRGDREKENFGVIAKKIAEKEHLRDKGYFVFDLKDFELLETHNSTTWDCWHVYLCPHPPAHFCSATRIGGNSSLAIILSIWPNTRFTWIFMVGVIFCCARSFSGR